MQRSPNPNKPREHEHTVEVRLKDPPRHLHILQCALEVTEGPDVGLKLVLSKPIIRIGTHERSDLRLTDKTVSRAHCEIRRLVDEHLLVDHGSMNGTFVGDFRAREVWLNPLCEIKVGASRVRFAPYIEEIKVEPLTRSHYGPLIGASAPMQGLYGFIDKAAPSALAVLIEGETGTGKELVARAIHARSRRAEGPFVVFDCSASSEQLLESELFGHEKDAFPGATRRHRGVFERATRGTLFLDGISELPLKLQPKFLRAFETGEIRRVGGEESVQVDVRALSASHRDLRELVTQGRFREDLYYRLVKAQITLAPLRGRPEDISSLVAHFLQEVKATQGPSDAFLRLLIEYEWPGNVRELRNVVERAAAFCEGDTLMPEDLPPLLQRLDPHAVGPVTARGPIDLQFKEGKEQVVAAFERDYLQQLLRRHKMNINQVAQAAGIDRRHVYRLMKKHGLKDK